MSASRNAVKSPTRAGDAMQTFTWVGKDKRGIIMKGEQAAKNVNLVKAELRQWSVDTTSPMPSYKDALKPDELIDLVAYVASLKGTRQ